MKRYYRMCTIKIRYLVSENNSHVFPVQHRHLVVIKCKPFTREDIGCFLFPLADNIHVKIRCSGYPFYRTGQNKNPGIPQ